MSKGTAPMIVKKGCYLAKGYSRRYWYDDHARHSTRQVLKAALRKETRSVLEGE
jgi:hypothetical protein